MIDRYMMLHPYPVFISAGGPFFFCSTFVSLITMLNGTGTSGIHLLALKESNSGKYMRT